MRNKFNCVRFSPMDNGAGFCESSGLIRSLLFKAGGPIVLFYPNVFNPTEAAEAPSSHSLTSTGSPGHLGQTFV